MKHIKHLYEFRQQLEIPFDKKHPIHDKPIYIHIQDLLQTIKTKTKPKYYFSNNNVYYFIEDKTKNAFDLYLNDINDADENVDTYDFICDFSPIDYPEYYNKEFIEDMNEYNVELDNYYAIRSWFIFDYLTDDGVIGYNNFKRTKFDMKVEDFKNEIEVDDNGLINIYRAMTFNKEKDKDIYENILKYNRVGIYWSWNEHSAEAHGGGIGETYILYDKVKPENVNWENTIYKNT